MRGQNDWYLTERIEHETGRGDPFAAAIRATRMPMVITDPRLPDNPIVYANGAFEEMSGYKLPEIIGRNCRFMQGPDTDRKSVEKIRHAIDECEPVAVELLNYRKDGSQFWIAIQVSPVKTEEGEVQFFFASQMDVTDKVEARLLLDKQEAILKQRVKEQTETLRRQLEQKTALIQEVDHRVKNNLAMVAAMVSMQKRSISDERSRDILDGLGTRIQSLASVHEQLYVNEDYQSFEISNLLKSLSSTLMTALAADGVRLDLNLSPVHIPANCASSFGIIATEIITNSLKHAFPDGEGMISIQTEARDGLAHVTIRDDGQGYDANQPRGRSLGSQLIERLSQQIGATTVRTNGVTGTETVMTLPQASTEQPGE